MENKKKWYYYGFKEIQYIWKQRKPLKENLSSKYSLWILDKKEAKAIAEENGIKIIKNGISNLKTKTMAKDENKKKKKKEGKEKTSAPKLQGGQRKFVGSVNLAKLQHVIMEKKNKKGKKVECILIPVDSNFIEKGVDKEGKFNGAYYLNVNVITKTEEDEYKQHGFIGQSVSSKMWKEAKEKVQEKMRKLPILGNLKDFDFNAGDYNSEASGNQGHIEENDDLPF